MQQDWADPHVPRLVWELTRNGKFLVKTAYQLVVDTEEQRVASSSMSWPVKDGESIAFWRKLWSIQVPPRVKVMAWRFYFEAVPTLSNLSRRNAGVLAGCVWCGAGSKSLIHILEKCEFTRVVWALSNIPWRVLGTWSEGVATWIARLSFNMNKEEFEWFLAICWALWHSRNKLVMEGKSSSPLRVIQHASQFLNQYK
ncbi:hypothetical protein Salat_1886800 [Sesamum alatum]|uniref:Reverse transcriptase zinc-binding domain-containing protein n=1 Tax=Sesamum alatum TaxID=300844 RepID=A0AAE1Y492_9LAMI|nr:hypothetical protein Salat_1886800 [Sesamum alatum]